MYVLELQGKGLWGAVKALLWGVGRKVAFAKAPDLCMKRKFWK
jgi:hypothetical protein